MTKTETRISTGDADPHFYLCGRLIGPNKPVVAPILSSVLSGAWNLKEKLLVREEESGHFVFQFKSKAERDQIVGGGPWSFNGGMFILAEYDGLSMVEDVSLNHLEVWVLITGLRFAMRNNMVLSRAVNGLGVFVRADPGPIQRKEKIQRVRVVLDIRNRIPAECIFDYSPEVAVKLEFKVERAHGICKDCGCFGHGGGTCDKGLICGLPVVDVVSAVDGEVELLASWSMDGLLKEPQLQVDEAAPTGVEVGLSGNEEAATLVVTPPNVSAGNPSFKLGLTEQVGLTDGTGLGGFRGPLRIGPGDSGLKRKFGFRSESDGFGLSVDGPAGTDLVLKKPKSSFSGELVEVLVQFGRIHRKKSPKKRGRPRGSRNKKRTMNGDSELSDSMAPSSEGANAETGLESEAEEE